jgi:hypothetical protein
MFVERKDDLVAYSCEAQKSWTTMTFAKRYSNPLDNYLSVFHRHQSYQITQSAVKKLKGILYSINEEVVLLIDSLNTKGIE